MYVNYGWETVCQVPEWAMPAYTLKPLLSLLSMADIELVQAPEEFDQC